MFLTDVILLLQPFLARAEREKLEYEAARKQYEDRAAGIFDMNESHHNHMGHLHVQYPPHSSTRMVYGSSPQRQVPQALHHHHKSTPNLRIQHQQGSGAGAGAWHVRQGNDDGQSAFVGVTFPENGFQGLRQRRGTEDESVDSEGLLEDEVW